MTEVFLKLVNMSITASFLVLAVLILRLILRKAPKAIHCALWAMVALRLVCPFSLESSLSLMPEREEVTIESLRSSVEIQVHTVETPVTVDTPSAVTPETVPAETQASSQADTRLTSTILPNLTAVWFGGMSLMLVYAVESYWRIRKKVSASIELGNGVYLCDYIRSPFILGVWKPSIYLPSSLRSENTGYVLAHERAHLKRRDHWWKPLGFLLLAVYWFNPVIWLAYILLCRDIELACDENVIRDMDIPEKKAYSAALLNCSVPRHLIAACPLAFGEVGVKERVKSVLHYKKPAFWLIILAVVACIAAAVCFLTDPKDDSTIDTSATAEWIDYSDSYPDSGTITTKHAQFPGVTFQYTAGEVTAKDQNGSAVLISGMPIWNVYFSDLTGDGKPELCATVSYGSGIIDTHVVVYDYANRQEYTLWERGEYDYALRLENGTLLCDKFAYQGRDAIESGVLMLVSLSGSDEYRLEITDPDEAASIFVPVSLEGSLLIPEQYQSQLSCVRSAFVEFYDDTNRPGGYSMPQEDLGQLMEFFLAVPADAIFPYGGAYDFQTSVILTFSSSSSSDDILYSIGFLLHDGVVELTLQDLDTGECLHSAQIRYEPLSDYLKSLCDVSRREYNITMYSVDPPVEYGYLYAGMTVRPLANWEYEIVEYTNDDTPFGIRGRPKGYDGWLFLSFWPNGFSLDDGSWNTHEVSSIVNYSTYAATEYTLAGRESATYCQLQGLPGDYVIINEGADAWLNSEETGACFSRMYPDQLTTGAPTMDTALQIAMEQFGVDAQAITSTSFDWKTGCWRVTSANHSAFTLIIDPALNCKLETSTGYSTYEVYNVAPLEELPETYSTEEATIDKCVVHIDGDIRYNADVWEAFLAAASRGESATVRVMFCITNPSTKSILDLNFDGAVYTLRWFENGQEHVKTYPYLRLLAGYADSALDYDAYQYYVLTDNPTATYEEMYRSLFSSQSADYIDFFVIFSDQITYPDYITVPELLYASLELDGETLLNITDTATVGKLQALFSQAEALGYEPKTYGFGPELVLHGKNGDIVTVELSPDSDLCRVDGVFYDFGPGYTEDGCYDALPDLLQLLNLSDWPDAVYG